MNNNYQQQASPINIFIVPSSQQISNVNQIYRNVQQYPNPANIQNYQYPQTNLIPNTLTNPSNQLYSPIQYPQIPSNFNILNMSLPISDSSAKKIKKKSHKYKKHKKDKKDTKKKDKKKESKKSSKKEEIIKEFKHQGADKYDGICNYLTEKTGSNIHTNGTINITSNNIQSVANCVDYKHRFNGLLSRKGNTYICFDFKNRRVKLTGYSILSFGNDSGSSQPKNWVIEVSKNMNDWIEIDRHENDPSLNRSAYLAYFNVQKKNDNFYQYIRIRQTGPTWDKQQHNSFGFNAIDFFGFIKEPKI